jgi:hypothetical protein
MPVFLNVDIAVSFCVYHLSGWHLTIDNVILQDVEKVFYFFNPTEGWALDVDLLIEEDTSQSKVAVRINEPWQHCPPIEVDNLGFFANIEGHLILNEARLDYLFVLNCYKSNIGVFVIHGDDFPIVVDSFSRFRHQVSKRRRQKSRNRIGLSLE